MSAHLLINGKKYFPSSALCTSFGYTSDYLGKLAREEKILGTLVGRQWFIEEESLKTFLLKIEIEKKILKEELSLQRKNERNTSNIQAKSNVSLSIASFSPVAFAQAVAILFCGVFLGSLGWFGVEAGIGSRELMAGAQVSVTQVAEVFSPSAVVQNLSFGSDMLLATVLVSDSESTRVELSTQSGVFTQLPQFPNRDGINVTALEVEHVGGVENQFSDEVTIVTDSTGQHMIAPVFKTASTMKSRFVVVPVNDEEN